MMQRLFNHGARMPGVKAAMLLSWLVWLFAGGSAAFTRESKGWVFLHPFFAEKPWGITSEKIRYSFPAAFSSLHPLAADFTLGNDNAMALLSAAGGDLYEASVKYQTVADPVYNWYFEFGEPKKITLGGLSLPPTGRFYVVKDSLYSVDSVRVALPVPGLKLYIATIRTAAGTIAKLDSVSLSLKKAGQSITGVFGDPDSLTGQDRGIWIAGAYGLIRFVPYTNHAWGAEEVYDLSDSPTVLFAGRSFASTSSGTIFKRQNTSFVQAAATQPAKAVWRVYPKGAVGDGGLFKELSNTAWKKDTAFGSASYRYANFVRKPGGFGVEVLDSAWNYRVFTYRDTASRIVGTSPTSLMSSINGQYYQYPGPQPLVAWIQLEDLDSNYRDYRLSLSSNGAPVVDCKSDGKFAIAAIPDTEDCHIGTLKMTSGYVRLTMTPDSVVVEHDCDLGASNSIDFSCYWEKYTFKCPRKWKAGDIITCSTATQRLSITNQLSTVAASHSATPLFHARIAGNGFALQLPAVPGSRPVFVAVHDLEGRLIASLRIEPGRHAITLPFAPKTGLVIVSCSMSDGSVLRQKVPIVR